MKKIVTIGRSFGSGGREVGKRLSEALNYVYYDKQLDEIVSEESGLSEEYVSQYSESPVISAVPPAYGRSFATYFTFPNEQVQISQTNVIKELAEKGNVVIVGRCADYILKDNEDTLNVFIYSSNMDKRVQRCFDKVPEDKETKTEKDIIKEIKKVDKERKKYYDFYTGLEWGEKENYHLCIDTSKISIKKAVDIIIEALKE